MATSDSTSAAQSIESVEANGIIAAPVTTSFALSSISSPAHTTTTAFVTPSPPPASTPSPPSPSSIPGQDGGISTAALAGLSLGLGLLIGLILSTGIYFYRRRRADKTGRGMPVSLMRQADDEALLGAQHTEKGLGFRLDSPPPQRAAVPPRIMDWVQRARAMSISSKASSWFPTIEDGESTVKRSNSGASTVMRTPSVASSRSMYSQASMYPSRPSEDKSHEFEGISRPPDLYMIHE
ncbi:hypothetical protein B0H16DRAFT_1598401 [Mycena metata]|uniref:Uncharacterized protein n=1 Tax=Mycena metata TaxID=1033252 RepID=A0AAD7MLW8_9AGAR|nr:hypothetical protein B0H16DRAFT_1598401 [Mycena metata]